MLVWRCHETPPSHNWVEVEYVYASPSPKLGAHTMRAILQCSCLIPWGYVAEFAEGARQGQLSRSEARGGSHSVERCGRRARGVFLLAPPGAMSGSGASRRSPQSVRLPPW